jgi:hypothetical protein
LSSAEERAPPPVLNHQLVAWRWTAHWRAWVLHKMDFLVTGLAAAQVDMMRISSALLDPKNILNR